MLPLLRRLTVLAEALLSLPRRLVRTVMTAVAFNPKLGPLRHVASAAVVYVLFAVTLVYVVAPLRGYFGQITMQEKLGYDAERWLATAVYDPKGNFVGTFDPRLDSLRDVNYTDEAITFGDYVANPDHKSIPVRETPPDYWRCLTYHEDRYLGGPLNPFGIDLVGVLKIPYTTVTRSIAERRLSLGVGGSTLPMQIARVIYKTPPSRSEGGLTKLSRKLREWWLAPVIYRQLTRDGTDTLLRQWAANHIWLAQRTGGQPLHGVEVTSQIVFGKEAKDLSTAEQFVLASAVNKPIILLEGSDRLNEVRMDRWRYITEVRARTCAERLITDEDEKKRVIFELIAMAGGPPDPKVRPKLQAALETYAPDEAKRAEANPFVRANVLLPSTRYGIREEMKQLYGFSWRDYVRGVTTTFDVTENLSFRRRLDEALTKLDTEWATRIKPGFTLDPAKVSTDRAMPNVILAAADETGRIVRFFENGETASYFGSLTARSAVTGLYDPNGEGRMVASTGKMLAAIAIANEGRDTPATLYPDNDAPATGLDTCVRGTGPRQGRRADVVFACSLNTPLLERTAKIGQNRIKALIDGFGFTMPPTAVAGAEGGGTPPSTAVVLGQISAAPRRVHHLSTVILASLIGRGATPIAMPSLVANYDYTFKGANGADQSPTARPILPKSLIRPAATMTLRKLLEAPLCHQAGGVSHGTLKSLAKWCAARRPGLRLHFAKTGTQSGLDASLTVDTWITGGLQFTNGAAYSYVVLVGTGAAGTPWADNLHASQIAAPLLEILLDDLSAHAKDNPRRDLLPQERPRPSTPVASTQGGGTSHQALRAPTAGDEVLRALNPN